jgi:excisionase family DNA binding protein
VEYRSHKGLDTEGNKIRRAEGNEEAMQIERKEQASGKVLKLTQAAEVLQCHPKTLRLMAQAGKIPARRVGKLGRFSADRLREWVDQAS